MTGSEVIRKLLANGCVVARIKGSHVILRCGRCQTVVPNHRDDIPKGTLGAIRRQVKGCIGGDWWTM